jgi:hypothetical protein
MPLEILAPARRYWRELRRRPLAEMIESIHAEKFDPVEILDIGGSPAFWRSLPEKARAKASIGFIDRPGAYPSELTGEELKIAGAVRRLPGDARDLHAFDDDAFDLVVCNAAISVVGGWAEMKATAAEARRIGRRGWIEIPAYEFPVALFNVPFAHWLSYPAQIGLLNLFGGEVFKTLSIDEQYARLEHMRPLTRSHVQRLFPKVEIDTERLILPKCHIAIW